MSFRRRVLTAMAAALLALAGLAPAQAVASASEAASAQAPSYCVIVVGKAPPGEPSPIRSRACGNDYATVQRQAGAQQTVLLMEWFWNANNQPPLLTRIHGDYGDCDSAGYRIIVKDDWANNISGFNAESHCNVVTGFNWPSTVDWSGDEQTWANYSVCACLSQGWVGSFMNDRIEAFWIRRG
ncbi:hypothetical protein MF672_016365 [Actinomadura sp. ATCC 31491]|uniref:Uncharacterized protein n=1 Tax=Actinomadura luzonensis TaxID=2805427 RepID=A0ABT0FSM9_9ACTN|nr:hypothetical protein [Actinomadura luzonensis]MCK2215349.1 hypothetical protein [Actinomadura luzonensis]